MHLGNLYLNVVKKDCFAPLAMTHNDEKTRCHCEERSDVAISRSSLIVNSFMRCKMSVNLLSIRVCRANNADFMQLVGLQSIRTNPFKICYGKMKHLNIIQNIKVKITK